MKNATKYVVMFEDQTSVKYQHLETLLENLEDQDALNVANYFDYSAPKRKYPFQALFSTGEMVMIYG